MRSALLASDSESEPESGRKVNLSVIGMTHT